MAAQSLRRSDRVSLTLLLEAFGTDAKGQEFKLPAQTVSINKNGAVIVLDRELAPEQQIHIRRKSSAEVHRQSPIRIVSQLGRNHDGVLYGVEILDEGTDLWGIAFPELVDSTDAVAKMLLECSYCRAGEVAHLSELELRAFEINRGIARYCKICRVPSIWRQAANEDEQKLRSRVARARRMRDVSGAIPEDGEQRERRRMRLHTRLTACIRQSGKDDELAVCEDISPMGMCFRSKRRYEANDAVEVAVPYSPDAANIFLPARIIYSEEIPKAGLFRHGTEYQKRDREPDRVLSG